MKSFFLSFAIVMISFFTVFHPASAQTNAQNTYVSAIDQDLAIKSIVLVPATDNVGGIYAKPIDEELHKVLNDDKQWSLTEFPKGLQIKSELLDEHPEDVKKILQAGKSEAALTTKLIKGPRGISITMTLYVGRDGLPLL